MNQLAFLVPPEPEQQELPYSGNMMATIENAVARATDPQTSHEAAQSISKEQLTAHQAAILGLLKKFGPMTDETIFCRLQIQGVHISPSGARSRRAELVTKGDVEDSGCVERLQSGRNAIVWRAK